MPEHTWKLARALAFVSRRASGVWTNLPSLTYTLVSCSKASGNVLWVDFGLRHEMLNHFRINPDEFPVDSCLLGMIQRHRAGDALQFTKIVTYDQAVNFPLDTDSEGATARCLSDIQGINASQYRDCVAKLSATKGEVFLLPLQIPALNVGSIRPAVSTDELDAVLGSLVDALQPAFTFFTLEGQPESAIFSHRLAEDSVLQWAISVAHMIICMVRFDSEQRFDDAVGIPTVLARDPEVCRRIRLLLTRAAAEPRVTAEVAPYLLGVIPYADFVGQSVSSGRIPVIDLWSHPEGTAPATAAEFLARLNTVAAALESLLS
jgi:hypothetical protein